MLTTGWTNVCQSTGAAEAIVAIAARARRVLRKSNVCGMSKRCDSDCPGNQCGGKWVASLSVLLEDCGVEWIGHLKLVSSSDAMPPKKNTKSLEDELAKTKKELADLKREVERSKRSMFLNQMREFGAKILQINSAIRFKDWQTFAAQQKAERFAKQVSQNNDEALQRAKQDLREEHEKFATKMQGELSQIMKQLKEAKMHNESLKYEEKKLLTQVHENGLEITAKDRALLAERDQHAAALSEHKQVSPNPNPNN